MNLFQKRLLISAVIGGLLAGCSIYTTTYAESAPTFDLDQMIVTATRTEKRDLDTSASVASITKEEIERSGAKTIYDVVEHQVGVTNNAYGPGGREYGGSTSRTVFRGLDKGTLVMVNGAPINMLNYNSMEGIPVEAVEKVEVVRGANSVLYGSEAFGGVVNIITKKGGPSKTTISGSIGNYDKKYAISSSGARYNAYYSKDYYGAIHQTNKVFPKSTRRWALRDSLKESGFINIDLNNELDLNYMHTKGKFYRDSITLKNGLDTETGAGTNYLYEDSKDNVSLTFDNHADWKALVSYNRRVVNPYQGTIKKGVPGELKRSSTSDWKLDTMTFDTNKKWNFGENSLVAGITYNRESADDRGKKENNNRSSEALYLSYDHKINDALNTTIGVRGQHISDPVNDQNVFLPQIQTLYKFNDTSSWYINLGKSFQMPALNQYFESGYRTSDLKPQEGWVYETGLKFIDDNSSLKIGLFYMDVDGKFEWVDVGRPDGQKILMNAGKFKNNGLEIEYARTLSKKWNYKLGGSISNPRTQAVGEEEFVQSDAALQLTATANYSVGKLNTAVDWLFLGNRENSYYDSKTGKKPTATGETHAVPFRNILNANIRYAADKHSSFAFGVYNIFNTEDAINKYENWGLPRNYLFTYNYTF